MKAIATLGERQENERIQTKRMKEVTRTLQSAESKEQNRRKKKNLTKIRRGENVKEKKRKTKLQTK